VRYLARFVREHRPVPEEAEGPVAQDA
jgi:hypothetical protein